GRDRGCGCDRVLSATVFAGSQPDRAGFQQTQSAPPKGRRAHSSETLAQNSRAPANYKRRGMPQLLPPCRLRFNVSGIRSNIVLVRPPSNVKATVAAHGSAEFFDSYNIYARKQSYH